MTSAARTPLSIPHPLPVARPRRIQLSFCAKAPVADRLPEMVSFVKGERGSETFYMKTRMTDGTRFADAQTARHRKQKLISILSDSGFEEDLGSSPISSHLVSKKPEAAPRRLSTWYLQYGDVGFKIQKEKEAHFHPCQSLAQQPQVGNNTILIKMTDEWNAAIKMPLIPFFVNFMKSLLLLTSLAKSVSLYDLLSCFEVF